MTRKSAWTGVVLGAPYFPELAALIGCGSELCSSPVRCGGSNTARGRRYSEPSNERI
jgi:hypothetical protein